MMACVVLQRKQAVCLKDMGVDLARLTNRKYLIE
jgi:hypothetical protein